MFDYIVLGAGTAGCTLAARLTENPSVSVLLIEAGPSGKRGTSRISAFPELLGSDVDWNGSTEPQQNLNARRIAWPRGKVLGGSGAIGAAIHLRGCRADYDAWRELGNPGWGYHDLAPLWTDPPPDAHTPPPNPLTEVFLRACSEAGITRYQGFSGPGEAGAGIYPVARVKGARWDATGAFLRPAIKRGNLTVWTGVQASRVLFENGRAVGVEYLLKGHRQQVRATREVILCAGAVGSPQILLLSGVGPADALERLGIPVAMALPAVGENLQDHAAVALRWTCPPAVTLKDAVTLEGTGTRWNAWRYRLRREGPLTSNLLEAGAYLKSSKDLDACDLEIVFTPLYRLEQGLTPRAEPRGFTLFATLLTPASRGRVWLASAIPEDAPRIDPCYLGDAADRKGLEQAAERARKIAGSDAFAAYRSEARAQAKAQAKGDGGGKIEDLEESVVSMHHGAGTCRMGPGEDCVVDAELRVHGVAGLRVADASVMPLLPRAHPNATVMAIAEKAARLIRES